MWSYMKKINVYLYKQVYYYKEETSDPKLMGGKTNIVHIDSSWTLAIAMHIRSHWMYVIVGVWLCAYRYSRRMCKYCWLTQQVIANILMHDAISSRWQENSVISRSVLNETWLPHYRYGMKVCVCTVCVQVRGKGKNRIKTHKSVHL